MPLVWIFTYWFEACKRSYTELICHILIGQETLYKSSCCVSLKSRMRKFSL